MNASGCPLHDSTSHHAEGDGLGAVNPEVEEQDVAELRAWFATRRAFDEWDEPKRLVALAVLDERDRDKAELATLRNIRPLEGHDAPCYYCGKPTNSWAANPGQWPIPLCHADEPGVVKRHHIDCVSERLRAHERDHSELVRVHQHLDSLDRRIAAAVTALDEDRPDETPLECFARVRLALTK